MSRTTNIESILPKKIRMFPTDLELDEKFSREILPVMRHLVVFSHLRWDFVFQRPQHLLSRFAREMKVSYFEEPIFDSHRSYLSTELRANGVRLLVPHLPQGLSEDQVNGHLRRLVDEAFSSTEMRHAVLWYYTPMALAFTQHLKPSGIVYDCMDELSHFKNAHPDLLSHEAELFRRADVVFTGGHSLFEHKKHHHDNIYPMPSSIDCHHFGQARSPAAACPADQASIQGTKIGFFGVIDERFDIELVAGVARARPDWQLIMLGPVVKIDPRDLPKLPNIHYLGGKDYKQLPSYIAGWDVAMLPFARNESTKFISPTKTPEYLAAGKPVVSTSIRDVVRPYHEQGLVAIADNVEDFVAATEMLLRRNDKERREWLGRVDAFLANTSWDQTYARMSNLTRQTIYGWSEDVAYGTMK